MFTDKFMLCYLKAFKSFTSAQSTVGQQGTVCYVAL